jgi:hypothetical protein
MARDPRKVRRAIAGFEEQRSMYDPPEKTAAFAFVHRGAEEAPGCDRGAGKGEGAMIYDADLYDALLLRFPRDEYVVLQEVSTVDGARRADAIAIALWASRGQEMHGFEVKASRSDWLRELKEPAKAEAMFNLCDRWWLLVTDESIVKDGELPAAQWGMLALKGKQLRTVVKAPPLAAARCARGRSSCRLLRKCSRGGEGRRAAPHDQRPR